MESVSVHRARNEHRDADVVAGDAQDPPPRMAGLWLAVPVAGQPGVQVDGVRHDRCAEHGGGQQDALGAVEARHQPAHHVRGRRRLDEQTGQESDGNDQQQSGDHPFEDPLAPPVLHGKQQQ
jgi:hypothetical protein